ncbi:MAG: class IV adenylate cyclase [Candidatus Bipolaricaulota bacterium]|nr:MAG: class IV adenylate cyclase [Candidatus Bipolaricaulota bacterium]
MDDVVAFRRNVEVKARIDDWESTRARVIAVAGQPIEKVRQRDIFFHTSRGRLKLRQLGPDRGQLIYYERPDATSATTSHYVIYETVAPAALREALRAALAERAVVSKERTLFLVGNTRIHLDRVEELGDFLELEVVLDPTDDEAGGRRTAADLLKRLGIRDDRLLDCAYVDLLADRET